MNITQREKLSATQPPSFAQALVFNVVGLVVVLGATLLITVLWQGIASTEEAAQYEINATLNRAAERLQILVRAAEMTAESAERVARFPEINGKRLRPMLEASLAAFEQRPELSYLCMALADTGEYGCLERTAKKEILLWLFPGVRVNDPMTRNYNLTDKGFILREEYPTDGYDPRQRPFYQAALAHPVTGTWIPSYQWIIHSDQNEPPLWGISYVKPLYNSSGHLMGVLDTDLDIPALNSFLQSLATEYHTQFQIVELGKSPTLIGDSKIWRTPLPIPSYLKQLLTLSNHDDVVDRFFIEGVRHWVSARHLPITGQVSWLVIASRKVSFIEQPLLQLLFQVTGIGGLIVVGLFLVSVRTARRFARPIAELEQRVAAIGGCGLALSKAESSVPSANLFRETQLLGQALEHMIVVVNQSLEAKEQKAASMALKGAIFDSTNTAILSLDEGLKLIECNTAAIRLFGLEQKQIFGQAVINLLFTPQGPLDWSTILATPGIGLYQFIGADGVFDAEVNSLVIKQNSCNICILFVNDISERKRSDSALRESLARFNAAALATRDVIWDWDITTNTIWWNENFQILFGYLTEDIEPTIEFWTYRVHPDDHDRVLAHIQSVVIGYEDTWSDEYRFRRKDGSYAYLLDRGYVIRNELGRATRLIGAIQDITERKNAEEHIRYLATHDALTGLPNRNLIQSRIEQAIARAKFAGKQFALLYLDLDRFKIINDGYGHPFGDAVLRAVAERLASLIPVDDTVARLGGDEFLFLLTDLQASDEAYRVANKVVDYLDSPITVQQHEVHLCGSIGVSLFPDDAETAEELIDKADMAMYRAKELGRNTYQFYTRAMGEQTQRRFELETYLRVAVAAGQLHLVYQPKVNLANNRVTGCEVLLRWNHPELGMVPPTHFIPVAEDSGLIVSIGDWVLSTACSQAKTWLDEGLPPVCVAVNISVRQFLQQDVASWVSRILEETGLPAEQLELELTESLIAQEVNKVTTTFHQLRAMGVKLSIDDFGTGYSSLSYLKSFRVDMLKIDQSFVRDIFTDPEDATIVKAVIALAHNLEFKVIAEGVETEQHYQFLRQNHCDEVQGFYISKPLPADEFKQVFLTRQ